MTKFVPNYDFLTVEDINTVILNDGMVFDDFYSLDTRIIESDNSAEYTNIRCDFIVISKFIVGNECEYILEIRNSLWDGNYSFTKLPNGIETPTVTQVLQSPNTLKIRGNGLSFFEIRLHLTNNSNARVYDSEMMDVRILNRGDLKVDNVKNITYLYCDTYNLKNLVVTDMQGNGIGNATVKITGKNINLVKTTNSSGRLIDSNGNLSNFQLPSGAPGKFNLVITAYKDGYGQFNKSFQINRVKIDLKYSISKKTQIKGAYNTNTISFASNTKIDKSILVGKSVKITANGKSQNIKIGNNLKASFEVNLRNTYSNSLSVKVELGATNYTNSIKKTTKLSCDYFYASNYAKLKSECENSKGADVIRLKNGVSYQSSGAINISRDITIQGEKGTTKWTYIDGNNKKVFVVGKAKLTLKGIELYKANPAIYQKEGSTVKIDKCYFKNNTNTAHNRSGSCIWCKIGSKSKKNDNLFNTAIDNSYFYNNHGSCFNHGGQLTIDGSYFLKDSFTYFNQPEPFIVYQKYGDCVIKNSLMDIDTGDTIKSSNASYAKAICVVGKNASFNGKTGSKMLSNNSLNLFNSPYNNKAHLYCKYYYPYEGINDNLIACPENGYEDRACCHAVESKHWVWRDHEYLGRVSWGTENRKRKLKITMPVNGGYF